MDELDADHKMYHYIKDIAKVLSDIRMKGVTSENVQFYRIEESLRHALEIEYYLQTILEFKVTFLKGPQ